MSTLTGSTSVQKFLRTDFRLIVSLCEQGSKANRGSSTTHVSGEGSCLLLEDNQFQDTANGENRSQQINGRDFQDSLVATGEIGTARETVSGFPGTGVSQKGKHFK